MEMFFYPKWKQKRVEKIIKIFGEDWFVGKKILELGACHGDIGLEFEDLGAIVYFSDARKENLEKIKERTTKNIPKNRIIILNQNYEYDLGIKFDLVLHLAVLNHVENWKQDLKCALKHSDIMILETPVSKIFQKDYEENNNPENLLYSSFNSKNSIFTQESVEKTIHDLGYSFIRFDDNNLNSSTKVPDDLPWRDGWDYMSLIYDWSYEDLKLKEKDFTVHRRMWLITKDQLPKRADDENRTHTISLEG